MTAIDFTELKKKNKAYAGANGNKISVIYEGEQYMLKFPAQAKRNPDMSYSNSCFSEYLGCQIYESIGIPVPGGRIELVDDDGTVIEDIGVSGELIYYGANVSLGYAVCREDLAKGDENKGRLQTGDIAYRDEEGYFYISGRKKRFVKLYGKRISLDQVQDELQEVYDTADIVCTGDDVHGVVVWKTPQAAAADEESLLQLFWEKWGIREDHLIIRTIDEIPRNTSGKTIYADLKLEDEEKSE